MSEIAEAPVEAPAAPDPAAAAEAAAIVSGIPPEGAGETPAATEAPAGEAPAEAPAEAPTDPLERIDARFSELRADLGIMEAPRPQAPAREREEPAEQGGVAAGLFDRTVPAEEPDDDLYEDVDIRDPEARDEIQSYVDQLVEQRVEQTLQPFFEGEMSRRRVEAAQELEHQYPELATAEVAGPVLDLQRGLLHELAVEAAGPQIGPALAQRLQQSPAGVKLVKALYLASKADATARSSGTPASEEQEVVLEQPGARAPSAAQDDAQSEAQKILNAGGNPSEVPSFLMG